MVKGILPSNLKDTFEFRTIALLKILSKMWQCQEIALLIHNSQYLICSSTPLLPVAHLTMRRTLGSHVDLLPTYPSSTHSTPPQASCDHVGLGCVQQNCTEAGHKKKLDSVFWGTRYPEHTYPRGNHGLQVIMSDSTGSLSHKELFVKGNYLERGTLVLHKASCVFMPQNIENPRPVLIEVSAFHVLPSLWKILSPYVIWESC